MVYLLQVSWEYTDGVSGLKPRASKVRAHEGLQQVVGVCVERNVFMILRRTEVMQVG